IGRIGIEFGWPFQFHQGDVEVGPGQRHGQYRADHAAADDGDVIVLLLSIHLPTPRTELMAKPMLRRAMSSRMAGSSDRPTRPAARAAARPGTRLENRRTMRSVKLATRSWSGWRASAQAASKSASPGS